jgi:uncharacterized membrane protein
VLSATQAAAQQADQAQLPYRYGPGPWWSGGSGWPFWWMCPLMMVIIAVVVFLVVGRRGSQNRRWTLPWQGSSHAALQILSERFARGEIHKDEYEENKAAIFSGR